MQDARIVKELSNHPISVASQSPILFLELGAPAAAHLFRNVVLTQGILGSLYLHPATPVNRSGVRFILNYDFCRNPAKVDKFVRTLIDSKTNL